ncbi:MAG TPA: thioredoxin family protein [Rubricoccaceae bacterium]|nr:thioredoxin family protein [Rubricoccaceae bacterium]
MLELPPGTALLSTSHAAPAAVSRAEKWEGGLSFEDFLPTAQKNVDLWPALYRRATVPPEVLARAAALPGRWHLLTLSADWCGDAVNTVPVLARLVEATPNLALRVLDRDEHLDLMDEHLTGGTARAIPAVLVLDEGFIERGWWGPRPSVLQTWFKTVGQAMDKPERYRRIRQWYARDQGRSTLEEVVALLERAAGLP